MSLLIPRRPLLRPYCDPNLRQSRRVSGKLIPSATRPDAVPRYEWTGE